MIPNSGLDAYTAFSGTEFLTQNSDSAPSAISDGVDPLSSGALNFSGGETMEVEIDGKKYRITNNLSTSQQLSYSVENGVTKFICSIFTITAVDKDVAYNLDIAGKQNTVITGNMDDTVTFSLTRDPGLSNTLYAGAGNDTINNYGNSSNIYGGDGDDVINVIRGNSSGVYGGSGNDTITLNDSSNRAYGEDGDDYIEINAGSSQGFGGDGNDSFSVMSGSSSRIDGGSGTNTLLRDNGTNTVAVNVDGANAFSETFAAGETKTILIDGLSYEVTNTSDEEQNFIYKINGDETEFWTGKFTIKAKDDDVSHNIRMMTQNITYYCGNAGDTVHTDGIGGTIYGGDGNDVMIGTGSNGISYFFGGKGNDSITIGYPLHSYVDAGDGDDVITVNSNGYGSGTGILGGDGNDTFYLNGSTGGTVIDGCGGDDVFYANGSHFSILGGEGNNTVNETGSDNYYSNVSNTLSLLTELDFSGAGDTKTITIAGVTYTITCGRITNKPDSENLTLAYGYNSVTGEIIFSGNGFTITSDKNKPQNIVLLGTDNTLYTGSEDDIINIYGDYNFVYSGSGNDTIIHNGAVANGIHGEDGDDEIILNGVNNYTVSGGNGNDTITVKQAASAVQGGDGDDTYNIEGTRTTIRDQDGNNVYNIKGENNNIAGGAGNDTFNIYGNNNLVTGQGGDDYYVILGDNNTIDGGTGLNYYVDIGTGNKPTNVSPDPNSQTITFVTQNQTKDIMIDGKHYTFVNTNHDGTSPASNKVSYSYNPNTGELLVIGSDITLICADDKENNIKLMGNNNIIQGGSQNDKITVDSGNNNYIYGNDGNDIITTNTENNNIYGNNGNDTIEVNASNSTTEINAGAGNDTLLINSDNNTNIQTGSGNNTTTITGSNNSLTTENGNNKITTNGNNNTITTGNGDNRFSIVGNENQITTGEGNKIIGIQGDNNTLTGQDGNNTINIIGGNNTITTGSGLGNVEITGNENTFTTSGGNTEIEIEGNTNNITTGTGNDKITIKGDNNIATSGSGDDAYIINKGDSNTIDGNEDYNTMINYGENTIYKNVIDITPDPVTIRLQIGANSKDAIKITIDLKMYDFELDFSTPETSIENIEKIDELQNTINAQRSQIGATINRLNSALSSQETKIENLTSSRSTIIDADIAAESAAYVKNQILQQTSVSLLSSTQNLRRSLILNLLQ